MYNLLQICVTIGSLNLRHGMQSRDSSIRVFGMDYIRLLDDSSLWWFIAIFRIVFCARQVRIYLGIVNVLWEY